eukprot:SAG31_NODE_8489_length_1442_cov_0.853313_1_plen_135_part_00
MLQLVAVSQAGAGCSFSHKKYKWTESVPTNKVTLQANDFIGNTDEGYYDYHLPFTFPFYGGFKTVVKVSTNGYLSFSGEQPPDSMSQQIPTHDPPNDLIAVYWTDLDCTSTGDVIISATDDKAYFTWKAIAYHT